MRGLHRSCLSGMPRWTLCSLRMWAVGGSCRLGPLAAPKSPLLTCSSRVEAVMPAAFQWCFRAVMCRASGWCVPRWRPLQEVSKVACVPTSATVTAWMAPQESLPKQQQSDTPCMHAPRRGWLCPARPVQASDVAGWLEASTRHDADETLLLIPQASWWCASCSSPCFPRCLWTWRVGCLLQLQGCQKHRPATGGSTGAGRVCACCCLVTSRKMQLVESVTGMGPAVVAVAVHDQHA